MSALSFLTRWLNRRIDARIEHREAARTAEHFHSLTDHQRAVLKDISRRDAEALNALAADIPARGLLLRVSTLLATFVRGHQTLRCAEINRFRVDFRRRDRAIDSIIGATGAGRIINDQIWEPRS